MYFPDRRFLFSRSLLYGYIRLSMRGKGMVSRTWSRAQTEMDAIARRLQSQYPGPEMPATIPVVPLDIHSTGKFRLSLWLLLGSVFLMLLIACINVAGLLLARGSVRESESGPRPIARLCQNRCRSAHPR